MCIQKRAVSLSSSIGRDTRQAVGIVAKPPKLRSVGGGRGFAPPLNATLGTNPLKLARLGCGDRVEDGRDERPEMQHTIRWRADEDHTDGKGGDVLLELEVGVHRDQGIVVATHEAQEVAVLDARPPEADDGLDIVAVELSSEV